MSVRPGWGRRAQLGRAVGMAGILFALLTVASILLLSRHPPSQATQAQVMAWYADSSHRSQLILGVHLSTFSAVFFLWFVAAVRTRIGQPEEQFLGVVFIASGVLFAACMLTASAAWGATAVAGEFLQGGDAAAGAQTVMLGRGLAYGVALVHGFRMAAVFTVVTSTLGLRTGALPRPLAVTGYVIAVVLIFWVSDINVLLLLFPVWVGLVSVVILRRGIANHPAGPGPVEAPGAEAPGTD